MAVGEDHRSFRLRSEESLLALAFSFSSAKAAQSLPKCFLRERTTDHRLGKANIWRESLLLQTKLRKSPADLNRRSNPRGLFFNVNFEGTLRGCINKSFNPENPSTTMLTGTNVYN